MSNVVRVDFRARRTLTRANGPQDRGDGFRTPQAQAEFRRRYNEAMERLRS